MGSLHAETLDLVDARVGQILRDKWHVDSLIGVGGMAAVYAATHRNGNQVALKVLHQQLSVDANIRRRFTREGYVANLINHPGIVRVLDDDETDEGSVFLVMDLLQGETAEARARRMGERLPLEDVLLIADGLLDVIAAAHLAGVIHRDIKPENVFFTNDREVKVLDFGIARLRDGFACSSGVKTAAMMGTPAFMPPEQALGRMNEVDALSDVWAVGATMFNLISGQLVHEAETPNELLILAATAAPRSLAAVAPDVPEALVEIVDRALAVDKANRWSSARAMQHALRQAATEVLRAPLPSPNSARVRVNTTPQAFRPMGAFRDPAGFDETLIENEWSVPSAVSGVAVLNVPSPPSSRKDPGTVVHPTLPPLEASEAKPLSSGKRVLLLAAAASILVAVAGSIGIGAALRSNGGSPQVATGALVRAGTPSATEPPASPTPPAETGLTKTAAESPPAPTGQDVAVELDVPDPNAKAASSGPSAPRPSDRAAKKSWLDRRK